ncbi:MAG: hypothetical protein ACP5O0_10260 [Acidimicrobiales bacterium]
MTHTRVPTLVCVTNLRTDESTQAGRPTARAHRPLLSVVRQEITAQRATEPSDMTLSDKGSLNADSETPSVGRERSDALFETGVLQLEDLSILCRDRLVDSDFQTSEVLIGSTILAERAYVDCAAVPVDVSDPSDLGA